MSKERNWVYKQGKKGKGFSPEVYSILYYLHKRCLSICILSHCFQGPVLAWLNAIEAYQKTGTEIPVNIKV